MRILFFNYEYPPLGGGAANATAYLLKEYGNIPDLSVDLVTSSVDKNYHQEKIGNRITIHKIPIGKNSKNLHFQSEKDLIVYSWKAYWFARRIIKNARKNNNPFNLTHSFFTTPCGFLSMLIKWEFSLPYIVSLRGADVPGYSNRFPIFYAFLKPGFRFIWKNAAAVISNSQGLKALAEKTEPKQEIGVIYNGVDVENFKPARENINREKFIITPGASRITARKGLKYLIEAVRKISDEYPQLYLKIMGDGNNRAELESLTESLGLKNKVEFLGRVPREKTAPYYQESSAFVLPSLNEGMSNAMLEALATGLPIISTDTGGAKELVEDEKNGFIIKAKNSDDIARKIEILINDEELRKNMGAASRALAEKMSWEKVAGDYHDLYKKIIFHS